MAYLMLLTVLLISLTAISLDCKKEIDDMKSRKLKNKLYRAMRQSIASKRGVIA